MPSLIGWKSIAYLKWSFIQDGPIFALVRMGGPLKQGTLQILSTHLDDFRKNGISGLHIISRPYHDSHAELVRTARRLGILTVLEMEYEGQNLPDSDTLNLLDGIVYSITTEELNTLDPESMAGINKGRTYIKVMGSKSESSDIRKKFYHLKKRGVSIHWMQDWDDIDNQAVKCLSEAFVLSVDGDIYLPCWLGIGEKDRERFYIGSALQEALAKQRRELKRQRRNIGMKMPCAQCEFNRLAYQD